MKIKFEFLLYVVTISIVISFFVAIAYNDMREAALPHYYTDFSIEEK